MVKSNTVPFPEWNVKSNIKETSQAAPELYCRSQNKNLPLYVVVCFLTQAVGLGTTGSCHTSLNIKILQRLVLSCNENCYSKKKGIIPELYLLQ